MTVPRRSIANRRVIRRLHMCANRKLHSSELFDRAGPTYTPIAYDCEEATSIPPDLPHLGTSSTTAMVPRRSIANRRVIRRLHMCDKRKLHSSELFGRSGPTYTPLPYDGGESTSIPPASPYRGTSLTLTTATVPRRSIANRRVNRRLHMWDKRKLRSSKLFCRAGPSNLHTMTI